MDEQQIIELLTKFGLHLIDQPKEKVKLKAEAWWEKNKHKYSIPPKPQFSLYSDEPY